MAKFGDNMKPLLDAIRDAKSTIDGANKDREHAGEIIAEARSELATKGIGKKPFDAALKYIDMNEAERRSFDVAYMVVREALGAPIQADLFDGLEELTPEGIAGNVDDGDESDED